MIVWVASFPRSGNTFLRIVLNRLYGLRTSVVYDVDGVAERVGGDLIGFEDRQADYEVLRASDEVHFIKTHRQRDAQIEAADKAICLVRDGRDALVSWARMRSEVDGTQFRPQLQAMMEDRAETGTGLWGRNVLSWLQPRSSHRFVLSYEDLVSDPRAAARRAMGAMAPDIALLEGVELPTFDELRRVDDSFFRRGVIGSHRDELPDDLHELFWSKAENGEAMALLGKTRKPDGP